MRERPLLPVHSDWYRPREELLVAEGGPLRAQVVVRPHVATFVCSSAVCLEENGFADSVELPSHIVTPQEARAYAPTCPLCRAVMRLALMEDADGESLWELG